MSLAGISPSDVGIAPAIRKGFGLRAAIRYRYSSPIFTGANGNWSASAGIDECRPDDIDHAETVIRFSIEDITGKRIAWSRPLGKTL